MAFVREHDRKRHQATHTGESGKQFSRQDALRRHAQYGRCPNRGPVPSQLANVKVGVFPPTAGDSTTLLHQADEGSVANELEAAVAMDVTADGESQVAPTNNDEEDQLAEDDGAAQGSKAAGKSRPRRLTATKKEKTEPAAPKAKGTKKKRKRSSFARPVDDGDSELDEDDEDGIVQPPPPPVPARKTKKQRKSPQPKAAPPAPARADSPEEEDELIDSYEEEDPNHAPSSFQFALPGVHSKEQIKASQSKKRVQPRRGRGGNAAIETETAVVETPVTESQSHTEETYDQVSIQPPSFASASTDTDINSGDKYASIIERMNRTPFGIEAEVMKTTFPLGLVRNVGGQPVPSEALQRQQADQDVTMSDWVQDQDSDADMSDENGGATKKAVEPAPTTQAAVTATPKEPAKGVAAAEEESSEPESDGPEEEDVAVSLGVEKASPIKETPPAVAAS
ncbi:hypothetical protein FRC00_009102 [Tulasnella sp. 408]|nr:hypothetical protein FRC00_009102 [Tulasnella sp. 408]